MRGLTSDKRLKKHCVRQIRTAPANPPKRTTCVLEFWRAFEQLAKNLRLSKAALAKASVAIWSALAEAESKKPLRKAAPQTAVECIWHIQDSHDQIFSLACT